MFKNELVIMAIKLKHSAEAAKERGKSAVFHTGENAEHFKLIFRYIEHNYVLTCKRWMNRHFKANYVFNIHLKIYVEHMLNIY